MHRYQNLLIIYYSGTGNSKKVSEWIAAKATEEGIHTTVMSFRKFLKGPVPGLAGNTLVGFCSATHGFNLPHSFLKLVFRFTLFPGSDVFIVNTRAGMKISKLFLPGLSGLAQILPAMILRLKGYRVRAMRPVDLPSNWISLHPGLKNKVVESMVEKWKQKINRFAGGLFNGKRTYLPALVSLPFDLLVIPLGVGYYFFGRFFLAKTFFATDKCNDCLLCLKACPTRSIVLKDQRPFWKLTCESCMHCMNFCPQRAIETNHNILIPLLWILSSFVNPWIADQTIDLIERFLLEIHSAGQWITLVLKWGFAIALFTGTYYVIHYLMHFQFFRRLMRWTTITQFRFWRRYRINGAV
jgi:Pyruvate/2-oxoacid:ferredoxin oxidoreductase delta subunit